MCAVCVFRNAEAVEIPASVEEIGSGCFSGCSSLCRVTFASGSVLKLIGKESFRRCENLEELEIPASVKELGEYCFSGCCSLSRLTFGDGSVLNRIGKDAFSGCHELNELAIPGGVDLPDDIGVRVRRV